MSSKALDPRTYEEDYITKEEQEAAQLEEELRNLQIIFMKGEKDHATYVNEARDKMRRQRNEIRVLQQERDEIMKNLRLSESDKNRKRQKVCIRTLETLSELKEEKRAEMDQELNKIKELDVLLKEWEQRVSEKNRQMGGAIALKSHSKKTAHQSKVLENRLEKAKEKLDKQLVKNRQLRDVINVICIDRRRNDEVHAVLETRLEKLKKERKDLMDGSKHAMESRDEACQKMVFLREKALKERNVVESEIKELRRVLDHDTKIKDFMAIKDKERQEEKQQTTWKIKISKHIFDKMGDPEAEHKAELNQTFAQLKELMHDNSVDDVVQRFIEGEERNFALFQLVNELNNQEELLRKDCHEQAVLIKDFEASSIRRESERHCILKELENRLHATTKEADFIRHNDKFVLKILDQIRIGIRQLFQVVKCDRTAIDALLGSAQDVQIHNVGLFLGAIEGRANELLEMKLLLQEKDEDGHMRLPVRTSITISALPPGFSSLARRGGNSSRRQSMSAWLQHKGESPQPGGVVAPDISDEVDFFVGLDDTKPLTRQEMEIKVSKAIIRRNQLREEALRTSAEIINLNQSAKKTMPHGLLKPSPHREQVVENKPSRTVAEVPSPSSSKK